MQPSNKSNLAPTQGYKSGSSNSMPIEPASEEMLKMLADKRNELEEITQINSISNEFTEYLQNLAVKINDISAGAKVVSSVTKNWNDTFIIMGLTSKDNKKPNELLRFARKQ